MSQLQVFSFNNAEVRTIVRDGEPWWIAADVCAVLDLSETHRAVAGLDDDEKDRHTVTTPGGQQEMTVINEPGLYSLILRSRKKEAKAFKRWITHDVVPSIRKTGTYSVRDPLTETDRLAGMLNQFMPALSGKVLEVSAKQLEMDDRLSAVEEKQKRVDPRAIEERMFALHQMKKLLVDGTKGQPQPVNHPAFWRSLKEHLKIASFQNRAALDVPTMDRAISFARSWCFARGVQPPTLFDAAGAETNEPQAGAQ